MPTFIENCNCKGARPSGIVGMKHNLRPSLTGRLLNDRHCARFIVAPTGFGKSSLAYEYAQIVFEFQHVFWIRCDSPCFLRDLDASTLSSQILKCDKEPKLIVCDDVPRLDSSRTQAFSDFVRDMLDADCEILACCTPSNDSIAASRLDSIQIRPEDMLLNDEETAIERLRGLAVDDFDSCGKQWRIASFAWNEGKKDQVVGGISQETLPLSLKCAAFAMLIFGRGEIASLSSLLPKSTIEDDVRILENDFPYLGIDFENGSFDAMDMSVREIAKGFGADIDKFRTGFAVDASDNVSLLMADMLVSEGSCARAAEFMQVYGKGDARQRWAERNGWSLAFLPDPLAFLELVEEIVSKRGKLSADICSMAAWSAYILGDNEASLAFCSRAKKASVGAWSGKKSCELVQMIIEGEPVKGEGALMRRLNDHGNSDRGQDLSIGSPIDWSLACELERTRIDDDMGFMDLWRTCASDVDDSPSGLFVARTLMFCGTIFLESLLEDRAKIECPGPYWDMVTDIARLSVDLMSTISEMNWPEYLAVKYLEQCSDVRPYDFPLKLDVTDVSAMRRVDLRLFEQSGKWQSRVERSKRKRGEFELTHPDPYRKSPVKAKELNAIRTTIPTLSIVLFGGLNCWIGDERDNARILTREKAKTLLALITLSRGREIAREKLVRMLWPETDFDSANKNLYVVWSYLKRSLSVGQSCPYLQRTQNGFRLDTRHVRCDLTEFEDLCRALLFGRDDMSKWEEMYEKVSNHFAEDLLPNITNNQSIESMRKMYRDQLVDGLVAGSNRLLGQNEARGAMWYAREAKRRDPSREDVYIALMASQIASDQRACALDTYFECRRYLSENMGIDPSSKVMELYRSIIEEEQDF